MTESSEYLESDDLIDLAAAAARPQASAFGTAAYPDIWTKAAALLQSIVGNHPLIDGNKRLGWLATAVFLELNGVGITTAPNDDVYGLVMRVASESPEVEDIAHWLRSLV